MTGLKGFKCYFDSDEKSFLIICENFSHENFGTQVSQDKNINRNKHKRKSTKGVDFNERIN